MQWDYINSALRKGFRSSVVAQDYRPDVPNYNVFEPQQKKIAKRAFNSTLEIRKLEDVERAKAAGEWSAFFGLDKLAEQKEDGKDGHCIIHYYNTRFWDGVNASRSAAEKYGNLLDGCGHYVLHVNPDQLILDNQPFEQWVKSDFAKEMVGRLGEIVDSPFFGSLVAVSESARNMWLSLLESVGACDMGLAERKIRAVPNGTDTDLYKIYPKQIRDEAKAKLGFGDGVEKVVLVMTRPSGSKGIKRVEEVMAIFNSSKDPAMKKVGFVIALPETGIATRNFVEKLSRMENLINEGRLKATIDISKVIQNNQELHAEILKILKIVPLSYAGSRFYVDPIEYPLTYAADVLFHVPKAEAFGLVVSEGLLSGCGVVTTNAGGIPEVVKNADGQAQVLDAKRMKTSEAVDAIMAAQRTEKPNLKMIKQFEVGEKITQVLHDGIQK